MEKIGSRLISISWDKIFLHLDIYVDSDKSDLRFILVNNHNIAVTEFEKSGVQEHVNHVVLNVTNSGINRCVGNGTYRLLITDDKDVYSLVEYNGSSDYLSSHNICFIVNSQKNAYTVSFFLSEKAEDPILNIRFQYTKNTGMDYIPPLIEGKPPKSNFFIRLKKYFVNKVKKLRGKIKEKFKRKYPKKVYTFLNKHFFKENGRNILFMSDASEHLSENLQCVYERMCERGLDKQYNIKFSLTNRACLNSENKLKRLYKNIKKLTAFSLANVIVIDDAVSILNWIILDKRQKVVQVWHSGAGFKCIGYARWGALNAPGCFSNHRQYTYFVSDSEALAEDWAILAGILKEQVIPTGMPRLDKFLDSDHRATFEKEFRNKYPLLNGKKIILFAPTYRGANQSKAYYPYAQINFSRLYDFCVTKNYVVLFKMHPFVKEPVPIEESQKKVFFDFTDYKSINDLFYVADLLITDYSSCMYEYSLVNKPMLAFAFDEAQYSSAHGFPRPYEENIPGKLCNSFDELMEALENNDYQYEKHEQYIKKYFDQIDTNNSDRVIDWLIIGNLPEHYKDRLQTKSERVSQLMGKSYDELLKPPFEEFKGA